MLLIQYLQGSTHEQREFLAKKAKTKVVYLKQLASGFRKASPSLAKRIEQATCGRVTRQELRPDIFA
jgi:DNA-binding transcriptional regulator YdaS (Cro superfamily)